MATPPTPVVAPPDIIEPTTAEWSAIVEASPLWEDVHDAVRAYGQRVRVDAQQHHETLVAAVRAAQQFLDPAIPRGPESNGWQNTVDLVKAALDRAQAGAP